MCLWLLKLVIVIALLTELPMVVFVGIVLLSVVQAADKLMEEFVYADSSSNHMICVGDTLCSA
jgi:hypothetical protein